MPTMTVPSATMRRLRRELEISRNRSKAPLAPTGGVVAKKPSPPPPSKAKPSSPAKSKCIGKGAQVRVRTRVGTVCTGQHLVLWLRAVVECAADEDADGCLRVAYDYTNGKFPRVARVSPNDVKLHVVPPADASATAASTGSSTATSDHSTRTSASSQSQQDKAGPPPRPTVAGKKLPLLKKLEKEMLMSSSKAIMSCL